MQIGQKIIRLDTVDSTNNYTANLVKEGKVVHGTVILADEQTAGRGQRGATWASKAGENLLLSLYVLPDNLSVENQVVLTHFTSLCVVEFLRKIGISAEVKWPNDIFVHGKKIAGILIENTLAGGKVSGSIIGLGLNVNQRIFEIEATSIRNELNEYMAIENVLFSLIHVFNKNWSDFNEENRKHIKEKYLEVLYLKNQLALFEDKEGQFDGIIKGVSSEGFLIVERDTDLKIYDLKEIKFISKSVS